MTTNHPEKLDEALIRPGRVDHQVAFTNATRSQIAQLFERMYTNDLPARTLPISALAQVQTQSQKSKSSSRKGLGGTKEKDGVWTPPPTPKAKEVEDDLTEAELKVVAREFALEIPEGVFSPAEIQGFLLKRKKEPRKAVREVGEWVGVMVERKRGGGGRF